MTTLTREQAAKRFAELPLPSTKDEHWRFTDLRGFDPAPANGAAAAATGPMLDLDVAARAIVTENGIEIIGAPEGIRFELLSPDYDATLITTRQSSSPTTTSSPSRTFRSGSTACSCTCRRASSSRSRSTCR